jgi:hypothetical protein
MSAYLQAVLNTALKEYEQQTGIALANHPLAEYLMNCNSVEAVYAVLRNQAQAFRGKEKVLQPINGIVSRLFAFSAAADLGLVRP